MVCSGAVRVGYSASRRRQVARLFNHAALDAHDFLRFLEITVRDLIFAVKLGHRWLLKATLLLLQAILDLVGRDYDRVIITFVLATFCVRFCEHVENSFLHLNHLFKSGIGKLLAGSEGRLITLNSRHTVTEFVNAAQYV